MNYKKSVEKLKGRSLDELCQFYTLDWDELTDTDRKKITDEGYAEDDGLETVRISMSLWLDLEKPYDAYAEWDNEEFEYLAKNIIRPAAGYIVFNSCTDWMGHSGYLIAESFEDALRRSYDVTQSLVSATVGGKALLIREYSHDVPTGANELIIAMTKREKRMAKNGRFAFAKPYISVLSN